MLVIVSYCVCKFLIILNSFIFQTPVTPEVASSSLVVPASTDAGLAYMVKPASSFGCVQLRHQAHLPLLFYLPGQGVTININCYLDVGLSIGGWFDVQFMPTSSQSPLLTIVETFTITACVYNFFGCIQSGDCNFNQ